MRYVALLRGINVGGNSKVEMSRLTSMFVDMGYENVRTYINSGNVLFNASSANRATLADKIEQRIESTFGFNVPVTIRSQRDIATVCKALPAAWTNDKEQKTDVLFLWDEVDSRDSLTLLTIREGVDDVLYTPGTIIWHIKRESYSKSGMNKLIGSLVYKKSTARNCNTVRKINALMSI